MTAPSVSASPARWPWVVLAGFLAIAAAGSVLVVANGEPIGDQVPFIFAFSMFGAVGALIVSRDRRNVIGLLLLWGSFTTAMSFLGGEFSTWRYEQGITGGLTPWAALVSGFGWLFGILPVLFFLPLLFPDGRLPSRRWRPLLWFMVATLLVLFVWLALGSSTVTGSSEDIEMANPLYVEALGQISIPDAVFGSLLVVVFGLSVASIFVRFRGADGVERQQIKWVAFGFLAAFIAINGADLIAEPTLSSLVGGLGFTLLPVSIGVAVLRFHLYDLDIVVRKALVFGLLALFATLVYVALVVGIGAWLGRGSSFLTMLAAVVVAVTFQPVRTRFSRFADRLVYGRRATPYEVLTEFSERIGDTYAEDDVLPRMARVLGEGTGAEQAVVWLEVGERLRPAAIWPPDSAPPAEVPRDAVEVTHHGDVLGALSALMPASDPMNPTKVKLVDDLAAQAGLVLRNVGLTAELRARLDDLKAAQKRLVAARDEERRRLERNIHDGAQQQLVALTVKARLARQLTERDPSKVAAMLEQMEAETQTALEDLRDLARGIYPPLLADKGLAAALEAQARKSPLPVIVEPDGVGRYPQEIEAAVYFSVLEALQNVAKYAEANRATVKLGRSEDRLTFEVLDDGCGFDPASTKYGSGLQGIADRLGALEGEFVVASSTGGGTRVAGSVPVHEASA